MGLPYDLNFIVPDVKLSDNLAISIIRNKNMMYLIVELYHNELSLIKKGTTILIGY